ncbi:acyl-CoA N-acyltransferase [Trichoderma sp. SZMC 28015]
MPLTVRPAAESDLPRSIAIERRAYGPNKTSPIFFPGEGMKLEDRIAIMTTRIKEESATQCIKVVDTELEAKGEEAMIAFSMWFIWSGDLRPSFPKRQWGAGTNLEACEAFFGEMDRRWWARFEGKPHVYLKLLHTDPDHQKRGAGGQCLKWGTAEADRLGLVSYLEASEEGRPLYEKYGFKEVDRIVVDLTKWGGTEPAIAYLMLRQPVLN